MMDGVPPRREPAELQTMIETNKQQNRVCFRMYTEKQGLQLGLVGWVKNTYGGTVVGQVQGPADMVEEMKVWLSKEGSPSSRITRARFSNQRAIDKLEISGFKTRF